MYFYELEKYEVIYFGAAETADNVMKPLDPVGSSRVFKSIHEIKGE